MIRILGSKGSSEEKAAKQIQELILSYYPDVANENYPDVLIKPNHQCLRGKVKDIDIVVFIRCRYDLFSFKSINRHLYLHLHSFCLVIEVKDHRPDKDNIKMVGDELYVKYHDKWHNASEQNTQQKFSFIKYLDDLHIRAKPWITNLIWLRNIPKEFFDEIKIPNNIINKNPSWTDFINKAIMCDFKSIVRKGNESGNKIVRAFNDEAYYKIKEILTGIYSPTPLDRKQMDLICQDYVKLNIELTNQLGNKEILLHGRGGTGKTIILLQMAYMAFASGDLKTLILTYNNTLCSNLRRLFRLMESSDLIDDGVLEIDTLHHYLKKFFIETGIITIYNVNQHNNYINKALEKIKRGEITREDFKIFNELNGNWNYLFVDEGQDWSDNERDLLHYLFTPNKLAIADGWDQLVRNENRCNWKQGLSDEDCYVNSLKTCMRMKSNLTRFLNMFAQELNYKFDDLKPHEDAGGGRVFIVEGSYFNNKSFHDQLMNDNADEGNSPIDMLVCVPDKTVFKPNQQSHTAKKFNDWGFNVWDAVNDYERKDMPLSQQLRIVTYRSCRGLEGWIVISLNLDELYESEYKYISNSNKNNSEDEAHNYACKWIMIAMTRAIDTIVIQINNPESFVYKALKNVSENCSDFVSWYRTTSP